MQPAPARSARRPSRKCKRRSTKGSCLYVPRPLSRKGNKRRIDPWAPRDERRLRSVRRGGHLLALASLGAIRLDGDGYRYRFRLVLRWADPFAEMLTNHIENRHEEHSQHRRGDHAAEDSCT